MGEFCIKKKVYYHDTDCGGVVYYANYLKYLEEIRTEYLLDKGIDLKTLANEGMYFVVAKLSVDYKSPAKYQDIINIYAEVKEIKAATIQFLHKITKNDTILVKSETTLVCVNKEFKPISISAKIKESL